MSKFKRVKVCLSDCFNCVYYTDMIVAIGDNVAVTTKFGVATATVVDIEDCTFEDPFKEGHAIQHIIENSTQKIYNKEYVIMSGTKTVEVKHSCSNRRGIFFTDLDLKVGDTVVYDGSAMFYNETDQRNTGAPQAGGMHVGIVTDTDPDVITAQSWVVDVVDLKAYNDRIERAKTAAKLKQKLDAKRKQFQDLELLKLIAQSDPETKVILDEYISLIS